MHGPYGRTSGIVLSYLLGPSVALTVDGREPMPALTSSPPTTGSPVVSFCTLPALQVAAPIPGSVDVPGDFNGDGTSSLLWFKPLPSQVGQLHVTTTASSAAGRGATRTGTKICNDTPRLFCWELENGPVTAH